MQPTPFLLMLFLQHPWEVLTCLTAIREVPL